MRPAPLPPILDQSSLFQQRKVSRHGRLAEAEHFDQLADTKLLAFQELQYPGSDRIGSGLEDYFVIRNSDGLKPPV